jgi:hypothetical protein
MSDIRDEIRNCHLTGQYIKPVRDVDGEAFDVCGLHYYGSDPDVWCHFCYRHLEVQWFDKAMSKHEGYLCAKEIMTDYQLNFDLEGVE